MKKDDLLPLYLGCNKYLNIKDCIPSLIKVLYLSSGKLVDKIFLVLRVITSVLPLTYDLFAGVFAFLNL
ncbi:12696_t:CDS:2 [Entrophospora sp. SA101]|nr:12696_t:CDS:2 [Entrophospora sp. SA101]CAJ0841415.1 19132_t:CDS:2 [Entrophospora sp. SA101]